MLQYDIDKAIMLLVEHLVFLVRNNDSFSLPLSYLPSDGVVQIYYVAIIEHS